MKADTRDWVRFAEEDFDVATALFHRRKKGAANGQVATRADARAALKACRFLRAEIRQSFGLPKK